MGNKKKTFKELVIEQEPNFEIGERVYFMHHNEIMVSEILEIRVVLYKTLSYRYTISAEGWREDAERDGESLFKTRIELLESLSIDNKPRDTNKSQLRDNAVVMVRNNNEPWRKATFIEKRTNLTNGNDEYIVEEDGEKKSYAMCISIYYKDYLGTCLNPWEVENKQNKINKICRQ